MNDLSPLAPLPLDLCLRTVLLRTFDALAKGETVPDALAVMWRGSIETATAADAALVQGGQALGLSQEDLFVLGTLVRLETDADLARLISACQQGEGDARPTPQTLCRAASGLGLNISIETLLHSQLIQQGMVRVVAGKAPLAVTPLALSEAMLWALGLPHSAPVKPAPVSEIEVPESYRSHAMSCAVQQARHCLVLRGGTRADQMLWAQGLAEQLGTDLICLEQDIAVGTGQGLGAALMYAGGLPVETLHAAPGQRKALLDLGKYVGTRLVLAGQDGGVEAPGWQVIDVALPDMTEAERGNVWRAILPDADAQDLPRIGAGRLAAIAGRMSVTQTDFRTAAGAEARADIEPHGRLVKDSVADRKMIASDTVRSELDLLAARCTFRGETGVRAVLAGPSGSGKTMACAWLATRLGQPLFKVDLASVVSKYIGETEENLARILDQAEAADVILLFDEADSLFGARTEAKDSSDRYANSQTNYLLSRIETHRGIVLLTTNGLQRMDSAFARRIDQMIDVPLPDARQRLQLWQAYLGRDHTIAAAQLQRLARVADIAGGHICTISQTAALLAQQAGRAITLADVTRAMFLAYRAMGRTPPDLGGGT